MEYPRMSFWMIGYTFNLCFIYPMRYFSSNNFPQSFHLQPTHGTLSLIPSLLFICPRTNQRPRPRPKAQCIILGLYPYNSPLKLRIFPLIRGEKVGFWFLRVKTIYFFDLHVWKHWFVCLVTAPKASEPAIPHLMLQVALCSPYPMVRDKSYNWHFPLKFERDNSHSILLSI